MASSGRRYAPRLAQHLLADFAAALREVRERAGLPTFRTMARRSGVGAATLWRAESGEHTPSLLTTIAYVEACDGDRELWVRQHSDLLVGLNGDETARPIVFVPWTQYFDQENAPTPTVKVLRTEMRRLWRMSGLTLQEIAEQTRTYTWIVGTYGLGVSTISELCNPDQTRVPRRRTVHGFLRAVGAPSATIERWLAVRNQLEASQDSRLREPDPVPVSTPSAKPLVVSTASGESVVDAGRQQLARFRLLRNDLAHADVNSSPGRIAGALESLGVSGWIAGSLSISNARAMAFVMEVAREMHKIMKEGRLTGSAAPMALELAVRRTEVVVQSSFETRTRERASRVRAQMEDEIREAHARESRVQARRASRRQTVQAATERGSLPQPRAAQTEYTRELLP
ncbi:hypothetical protein ADL26_07950 [Thermoactinomyces vulgaris]|nr:hypothetical protein ADL26_07950 [Thermoactinomyces vulgaris]